MFKDSNLKKLMLENSIKDLIHKLFEGIYFILEKSETKEQFKESLEKFESDFISSFKL